MKVINSTDDIKSLIDFFEGKSKNEVQSEVTSFSNIDKVYKWTNVEFELYPKNNLENISMYLTEE